MIKIMIKMKMKNRKQVMMSSPKNWPIKVKNSYSKGFIEESMKYNFYLRKKENKGK